MNGRLEDGVFMDTLLDGLNIIKDNNNEHYFSSLGDNMKPRTGLILIAVIFILAGSFDYADELNAQNYTQGE